MLIVALCLFQNMKIRLSCHYLLLIMLLLFVIVWLLAVQFLWQYRCATFTVTQALLCPLHCGPLVALVIHPGFQIWTVH